MEVDIFYWVIYNLKGLRFTIYKKYMKKYTIFEKSLVKV